MNKIFNIPEAPSNTLQYFVDGKFMGNVTVDQVNKIRENVVEYVATNKDATVLNRFYFIGHEDSNDKPGKEIKVTMDCWGNLSDCPWEMNHVRRSMFHLMHIGNEYKETLFNLEKKQIKILYQSFPQFIINQILIIDYGKNLSVLWQEN